MLYMNVYHLYPLLKLNRRYEFTSTTYLVDSLERCLGCACRCSHVNFYFLDLKYWNAFIFKRSNLTCFHFLGQSKGLCTSSPYFSHASVIWKKSPRTETLHTVIWCVLWFYSLCNFAIWDKWKWIITERQVKLQVRCEVWAAALWTKV